MTTVELESRVRLDSLAQQLSYLEKDDALDFVELLDMHMSDLSFTTRLLDRLVKALRAEGETIKTPAMSVKYPDHTLLMEHRGQRVWLNREGLYVATQGDRAPPETGGYPHLYTLLQLKGL